MAPEVDADIARLAAGVRRGSIIAAAGCGKTEQIARAVGVSEHRRLILTHTHAGVDALTRRLKKLQIPSGKYRIDTIAGWCLRFAASFPRRSGILSTAPNSTAEWDAVYAAGACLLDSGAVDGVINSSYGGCFVDEYQDCTLQQHDVIRRLANHLPTCVFGDPLQAIFDFRGQRRLAGRRMSFQTLDKQPNWQLHGDGRTPGTRISPNGFEPCGWRFRRAKFLISAIVQIA